MIYEVWETRTGNLAGSYDGRDTALRAVREAVRSHGRGYVDSFALVSEDARGNTKTIAMGSDLADLAERSDAPGKSSRVGRASPTASGRARVPRAGG